MKLSYYINFILKLESSELLSEKESFLLDGFDISIVILDDVVDQSKTRDGEQCFYIIHGIEKTKLEARRLYHEAFKALSDICKKRNLRYIKSWKAKFLLRRLYKNVEKGQILDAELEKSKITSRRLLRKYDNMITLFTGNHVKSGFALGYLISNKKPKYKNTVLSIGKKIGILRQIDDDIRDYDSGHHEPFGDLVQHKKRLPELLFLLNSSDEERDKLLNLLNDPKVNYQEIKDLIFNEKVRKELSEKTTSLVSNINLDLKNLPENYQVNLMEVTQKFSNKF